MISQQSANVEAGGSASAVSGTAASAGGTAGTGAQARSGSADALGLAAQNTVNTAANVSVNIGGQNFAPIQIVVESVTNIINWGMSAAVSGDSVAGSGAAGQAAPAGGSAASGSAQATGAQVQNTVDLRSSASVRVAGDNYNPITIVLDLAANLVNWGWGSASTGDVLGSGGEGLAASGASSATGLQVTNLVNMWADAYVDIEGNNYAPIFVYIRFATNISNYGAAAARTGDVGAGSAATTTVASGPPEPGVVGTASHARSGDAVAIANSVDHVVNSTQLSGANASGQISSATINQLLGSVPSTRLNPLALRSLPAEHAPEALTGLAGSTGDAVAQGMHSTVIQNNTQLSACVSPGDRCTARNIASLSVSATDLPNNPITSDPNDPNNPNQTGAPRAESGGAFVNATPTPKPVIGANGSGQGNQGGVGNSGGNGRGGGSGGGRRLIVETPAYGHVVGVDLFGQWPGRRLPPMPGMLDRDANGAEISAALAGWPGVPELPLPEFAEPAPAPAPARPRAVGRQAPMNRLVDMQAEEDTGVPVLAVVDVDFWSIWPPVEPLPMPYQAARGVPVARPLDPEAVVRGRAV